MKKPFDNFYIRNLLILIALLLSLYLICGAFFITAGAPERVYTDTWEKAAADDTETLPDDAAVQDGEEEKETKESVQPEKTEESEIKSENKKTDEELKPQETKKPKKTGKPYYVKVNCRMNTVTVYARDDDGEFSVPVKAMLCSTGGGTPRGRYNIENTGKWNWLDLVGGVYGQYCTQIKGNYLFHSVPYTVRYDKGSLQPGEYDKLGSTCSHGCIRLTVADAKWIYDNKSDIAGVELYDSSTAGPLGKPSAQKIGAAANSGWDPTDPDPNNPWHKKMVSVESYAGMSELKASEQAKSLGLKVGSSVYQYSDNAKGTVIAQSISAGTQVGADSLIIFTVSKGPEPAVPTATPEITNLPE